MTTAGAVLRHDSLVPILAVKNAFILILIMIIVITTIVILLVLVPKDAVLANIIVLLRSEAPCLIFFSECTHRAIACPPHQSPLLKPIHSPTPLDFNNLNNTARLNHNLKKYIYFFN